MSEVMTNKLIKVGAFLFEICMLLMLYSAALLAPVPFGFIRIGCVLFAAVASCALAYIASFGSEVLARAKRLSLKEIAPKPAFIIWMIVVIVIILQLVIGLVRVY